VERKMARQFAEFNVLSTTPVSPFPRRRRIRIGLHPASVLAGIGFHSRESWLVAVLVSRGEAIGHHLDESLVQDDATDLTMVTVNVDRVDADALHGDFHGQILTPSCRRAGILQGRRCRRGKPAMLGVDSSNKESELWWILIDRVEWKTS
jgi:hypothetical protein